MFEKNVSGVVVMENDELVGIFTERDYARKVILQGKASKETVDQRNYDGRSYNGFIWYHHWWLYEINDKQVYQAFAYCWQW